MFTRSKIGKRTGKNVIIDALIKVKKQAYEYTKMTT